MLELFRLRNRRLFRRSLALSLGLGLLALVGGHAAPAPDISKLPPPATAPIDFARDIQPIFAQRCYSCHGPNRQEAEFRLDDKSVALKGGELGPAIVPGKSAESLLIHLVGELVPGKFMPKKGERLSVEQISLLRAWIDQGAAWPADLASPTDSKRNHWAFKVPVRPSLPSVKNKKWVRNPIDNFVLARLEKEKLKPSPEADRVTLIRRLSLDLIGLPPTIKEVDEFVSDKRPDAYERVVDRLLTSPHYGEKWARHWLDVARYADTNGYEKDKPRSIWPYRDWVINAYNRDLPFDEFVIEQLAGDLLPKPTRDQRIATGFLRNSMLNQEGGVEPEQFRVEALIDRMDTLGKAFLGLTVNCCQCHNHKYDPFTQKEYYQLYAFLNNDDEAFLEVPTAADEKKRKEILATIKELETKVMKNTTNLAERMAAWESSVTNADTHWTVLDPLDWHNFATKFEKQEDKSLIAGGDLQSGGVLRIWLDTELTNITGFRLEALTNPNLPHNGPGMMGKGMWAVREFTVEAYATHNPTVTNKAKFVRAVADLEAPGYAATNAIDGVDTTGWTASLTPDHLHESHVAAFECAEPLGFPGGTRLLITVNQTHKAEKGKTDAQLLGCLRLAATTDQGPLHVNALTPAQRKLAAIPANKRTPAQQRKLFSVFRLTDTNFATLNSAITNVYNDWPNPPTTLVLQQRETPRVTHLFKRGDRLRPAEAVEADVPSVLNVFPVGAPRNRLGLAKWIVDRRNPTMARVAVNRVWMNYFGQGLVNTPEDFGTRVETPSHPELLDWLASEFAEPTVAVKTFPHEKVPSVETVTPTDTPTTMTRQIVKGKTVLSRSTNRPKESTLQRDNDLTSWSLKHLHRLVVTSATYRQASKVSPDLYAKDAYNRLLARAPRLRVEGEVVRDIALATSGLLSPKVGGPSVYPPIPGNVGDTAYGGFSWPESTDERYRRGLYTFWKRSLPFPALAAFDAPSGETSCPRRARSNTPLQALTTLNEKTFTEAAQAMALRVIKNGGMNDQGRVTYAFKLCTGRKPTTTEVNKLLKFWQEQYDYFENRTAAAVNVAVPDVKNLPADVNLHKVAAWAMVSRAILNLDETITKE